MEGTSVGLGDAMLLAQRGNECNNAMFNNPFVWLIWLAFFGGYGGGGFGFGNRGGGAAAAVADGVVTRAELAAGFANQGIQDGIAGITRDLTTGFSAINANINESRFDAQKCCCETQRAIDSVKYENAQNTCAITTNATANTQRILDRLCQMEASAKEQRIQDLQTALQTANFQLSQQAQNATLISTLRPMAQPAYLVQSPYIGHNCCCTTSSGTTTTTTA